MATKPTDLPPAPPPPTPRGPKGIKGILGILIKAVEQSPISVIITDTKGIIQYVNPKFTELMGYSPEETIGKTPRIIKGDFLSKEFYRELWEAILSGKEWHGVFHNRTKYGTLVWEVASISPIRDEHGMITHFVGVKEDITEIRRLQDQLEHMARHDQLTGLPNRFLFNDRLQQALIQAKRRKSQLALMYLDLDDFKFVNDTHGHEAGDALLVSAGQRMTACVRESDTVARMGGDEFTILLGDIQGRENITRIADLLIKSLGEPFPVDQGECSIGVSIGIAVYPDDGETLDILMSRADLALYQVKREGRNAYRFADPDSEHDGAKPPST